MPVADAVVRRRPEGDRRVSGGRPPLGRPTWAGALAAWRAAGDGDRPRAARCVLAFPPALLARTAEGAACLVETLVAPGSPPPLRAVAETILGILPPQAPVLQAWTSWCRTGRTAAWTDAAQYAWQAYVRRAHATAPALVRAEYAAWVAALPTAGPSVALVLLDGLQLDWDALSSVEQSVCIATVDARLAGTEARVTWLAHQVATLPALANAPVVHHRLLGVARQSAALAARRFGLIVHQLDEARPVLEAHRAYPAIFDLLLLECLTRWGAVPYAATEWASLLATVGAEVRVALLGALPAGEARAA